MILVIDTSSAVSCLAILDDDMTVRQELFLPARSPELVDRMRAIAFEARLTKVAVATGPGSFTGLRMGVSFGLGLAMGLRVPIVALPTLWLQAARSDTPAIAVSEAGRGRVYYLVPGDQPSLGEPGDIPKTHPLIGSVSPAVRTALTNAGHVFRPEAEMRSFGEAAGRMLKTARDVPYDSLKLEYMQSFSASR